MFRNPTTDLLVALLIVLLIFGPKRLPGLGKQLGQGIREFKDSITGDSKDDEDERPAIPPSTAQPMPHQASASSEGERQAVHSPGAVQSDPGAGGLGSDPRR